MVFYSNHRPAGTLRLLEMRLMPVLFLSAFYLFEKKRFWWFTVCVLLMTIREDMSLFVAVFGLYALMRHRPLRWIFTPVLLGTGWFLAMGVVLLAMLGPGAAVRASLRYSNLGSSGGEIVKTIFFRPWKVVQAALADSSHIGVIYGLLLTFGLGIPLLSGASVLAIPAVAELMLQRRTTFNNFMAIAAVPTLMVARSDWQGSTA